MPQLSASLLILRSADRRVSKDEATSPFETPTDAGSAG